MNEETIYTSTRISELNSDSYPYSFKTTNTYEKYISAYSDITDPGDILEDTSESLAGRVYDIRFAGKKLCFLTTYSCGKSLQYIINKNLFIDKDNYDQLIRKSLHRGDIVGARGHVGRSKRGELSLFVQELSILTPCLKLMPKTCFGIQDPNLRATKRYLDLIANPQNINVYVTRSKVYSEIRRYLERYDFIEVNTPVLTSIAGGASAKPFVTYHNDLDKDMYMRVAPELLLKKLVVGGIERVYEIGPQFRNESIDRTHNPEFYSLEFYMAFADVHTMMDMCEKLLRNVVIGVHNKLCISYDNTQIDFNNFTKLDIMDELQKNNIIIPSTIESEITHTYLNNKCYELGIECSEPRTSARLLDKLIGHFIEPKCINPTFLCNHPLIMSPLAKNHRDDKELTERFELFINGMEICNAYTELNDPIKQGLRFKEQLQLRQLGDEEAHVIDESFIDALEYGLPPTGGCGIGLDRLIMLLCDKHNICDVLTFPTN